MCINPQWRQKANVYVDPPLYRSRKAEAKRHLCCIIITSFGVLVAGYHGNTRNTYTLLMYDRTILQGFFFFSTLLNLIYLCIIYVWEGWSKDKYNRMPGDMLTTGEPQCVL